MNKVYFSSAVRENVFVSEHENYSDAYNAASNAYDLLKRLKSVNMLSCMVCVKIHTDDNEWVQFGSI